jgi:hypothetical protein
VPRRLVTAGYIAVVIGGAVALNHASEERSQAKLRSSENACQQQGNPSRALDRVGARGHELQLREQFQPIVDCHATYFDNAGDPVPLDFDQQLIYVEYVRRGIRPVVRADGTVAPE